MLRVVVTQSTSQIRVERVVNLFLACGQKAGEQREMLLIGTRPHLGPTRRGLTCTIHHDSHHLPFSLVATQHKERVQGYTPILRQYEQHYQHLNTSMADTPQVETHESFEGIFIVGRCHDHREDGTPHVRVHPLLGCQSHDLILQQRFSRLLLIRLRRPDRITRWSLAAALFPRSTD